MPIFEQSWTGLGVVNAWSRCLWSVFTFGQNSSDRNAPVFLVSEAGTVIAGPNVEPSEQAKVGRIRAVRMR
jgi:hypothetical protein